LIYVREEVAVVKVLPVLYCADMHQKTHGSYFSSDCLITHVIFSASISG
jgi:hypothetical protein